MQDGLHKDGENDVRIVQDGKVVRRVTFDSPEVTVTRVITLDPQDGNPRDVFDVEVRNLEDAHAGVRRCSFCEKTSAEVKNLIAGPNSYICDECVSLCSVVLADEA